MADRIERERAGGVAVGSCRGYVVLGRAEVTFLSPIKAVLAAKVECLAAVSVGDRLPSIDRSSAAVATLLVIVWQPRCIPVDFRSGDLDRLRTRAEM
jgi:hypothetical protein